jgi:F-type H+-transporting ATPase subunit b
MGELIRNLGIDWKLLIANTLTFFIVLWILRKFAYGPIMQALEKRQQTISQSLEDAKRTTAGYAELQQDKERLLAEAKKSSLVLIREAETEAARLRQAELAKTQTEANQILEKTRTQLERERQQMLTAAKGDLAKLVVQATEQVLAETVDASLDKKIQDQALQAVKHV